MNCISLLMSLMFSTPLAVDVNSNHVGNVFVDVESVKFNINTTAEANLSVIDYYGKNVYKGKISTGKSELDLGKFQKGYYVLSIKSGDELKDIYFAVLPSPESRPDMSDSAIASDIAMSWLVKPEQFDDLAKLIKLSGIVWVRDRISWGELETTRGKFADDTKYDLSADIQTKNGLKVYQVFHATPGWAQEVKVAHSFPDDLRDVYNFGAEMARRYRGKVDAWEVWNEPDISVFSDELGDSYASMLKAMYLGFKSVDPDLLILSCSFAMGPGRFADTIFQNDVGNYFDIYNHHVYDDWKKHVDRALNHINLMKKYGLENKPIWLTEAGRPIRRQDDMVEYNVEQGRDVAEFLPKAIITSLLAGVDKYFWFILPYYRENDFMLFGLLRQDLSPTPGYCSMSAFTYALGEAKYLGRLDIAGVYAHVFKRSDNEIAIAFWADEGKKAFKFNANVENGKLINVMGVDEEVNIGKLEATSSVKYLVLPADSLLDSLKIDYPRSKPGVTPYNPAKVSPIVVRLRFPRDARDKKDETYKLKKGVSTRIGVELYNFSSQEFPCKIELQLPNGWQGTLNDDMVTISRMGMAMRDLVLSADNDAKPERDQIRVNIIDD
ncbi:MAG: glycosyl hydrolase, partial [Candidatus Poribacteria bacterium]